MLFIEPVFLFLFLPIVLLGWWKLLKTPGARLLWLTVASWVFYSWFEFPRGLMLLPLLLASTGIDYAAGRLMTAPRTIHRRKLWLVLALSANLGILAIFKYLGFFEASINAVLAAGGSSAAIPVHDIILPVGISFYTFNSMSYTIDIYRGKVDPATTLVEYSAFVALFPHLVAGPIVRYTELADQLRNLRDRPAPSMTTVGIWFFVAGLFKKLVIADTIAPVVDGLYANHADLGFVAGWCAAIGYGMQLYFDFSAYSDMAVGLALMLGLRFPQNFDSPYRAVNISDFWRRWHMTLSRWLRDYLYIPLGGSRDGRSRTLRNLFIVMFLGGLWHGAAWTFVIWGIGHGLALVIHAVARDAGMTPRSAVVSRVLTFATVMALWVPFRAPDMSSAATIWGAMLGFNGWGFDQVGAAAAGVIPIWFLACLGVLIAFVNLAPNTWEVSVRPQRRHAVAIAGMAAAGLMLVGAPSPFLYFQF